MRREALVGASLNHTNLVSVYDVLMEDDGDLTIVMQQQCGGTVEAVRSSSAAWLLDRVSIQCTP